ncbi:transcriptional regulator [Mycobacteroides abscessus subsp. abscessus]|nr:transcriptional regulator [Mycobacteroides abscessus subsp. abscessus]
MPRNRRPRDREEKRAEIVAAARRLFTEQGYDAVPVSRIAQDAGVVSNTRWPGTGRSSTTTSSTDWYGSSRSWSR